MQVKNRVTPPKRKHKNEILAENRASNKRAREKAEQDSKAQAIAQKAAAEKKRMAREVQALASSPHRACNTAAPPPRTLLCCEIADPNSTRQVKRRAVIANSPTAKVLLEKLSGEGIITPPKVLKPPDESDLGLALQS